MSKISLDKYDRAHMLYQALYARKIDKLYKDIISEISKLGFSLQTIKRLDKPLSFTDYPRIKKKVDALIQALNDGMILIIENGIKREWKLANKKSDELCIKGNPTQLFNDKQNRHYNNTALQSFIKRKDNGMGLSDRVWDLSQSYKKELEMGLSLGIKDGKSVDEMSLVLVKYLKHPEELYHEIKDNYGVNAIKSIHPGAGRYRSSYKNARRLIATETNMAYRTAEHERWQDMDFVVGIKIQTSETNHTEPDICDVLQGDYPKGFKWVGWHPHCRCFQTPIINKSDLLLDEDEESGTNKIIKELPPQFKRWHKKNRERINSAKSLPYFLKDNDKIIYEGIS